MEIIQYKYSLMLGWRAELKKKIGASNQIIAQAFKEYGPNIGVCFNGGKDSTVILDLVLKYRWENQIDIPIKSFYLDIPDQFKEVTDIIKLSQDYWSINHIYLPTNNLKVGLQNMVEKYNTKAIFLGVRSTDPEGKDAQPFEPTSEGWPKAMRVMPILNWSYKNVWNYIDQENLPVCSLYEKGYTSIGSKSKSQPNSKLYDEELKEYMHARELENDSYERIGRD